MGAPLPPLVFAVPGGAAASEPSESSAATPNSATRIDVVDSAGDTDLGAAAVRLRAARRARAPLLLRGVCATAPCVREWGGAEGTTPGAALAARGGGLAVRAFVSGSGELWLDGSSAPRAVLAACMSVETTLAAFLAGDGEGEGGGAAAAAAAAVGRWPHRYLVENLGVGSADGGETDGEAHSAAGGEADGATDGTADSAAATAALRRDTSDAATAALLSAFDGAAPRYHKLFVAVGSTRTQLHRDGYDNLYVCCAGTRRWRVAHAAHTHLELEPGAVSADERYQFAPRGRGVEKTRGDDATASEGGEDANREGDGEGEGEDAGEGEEGVRFASVELRPGDALFMPRGWWHEVEARPTTADGVSCAVNWYFESSIRDTVP